MCFSQIFTKSIIPIGTQLKAPQLITIKSWDGWWCRRWWSWSWSWQLLLVLSHKPSKVTESMLSPLYIYALLFLLLFSQFHYLMTQDSIYLSCIASETTFITNGEYPDGKRCATKSSLLPIVCIPKRINLSCCFHNYLKKKKRKEESLDLV